MSDEFYDQEKDSKPVKDNFTWADAHAIARTRVALTPSGVNRFSNNMGHGAECHQCSAGILEDQEADLNRDTHFKNSINKHLGDNNAS